MATLETLEIEVKGLRSDLKKRDEDLKEDLAAIREQLKEMNGRSRKDHDRIVTVEGRVNNLSGLNAILTLVASVIAGFVGTRK